MKFLSAILALAASLSILPACGQSASGVPVGLSLPTQREERWVRDKERMVSLARELGINLKVQVSDNDSARQVSQCEQLMAQGIKVLIVAPHDATSAAIIVDKAAKAGVKVISYDRLILNAAVDLYVSFDNVKVGELQGEFLTKLVPKGNYVVLAGASTDNNAKQFREGAMKRIQPLVDSGAVKIVMDQWVKDWQKSEAQKIMEQALARSKNDIQGVLAPNDGTADGVIQALDAQKLAGKVPVTGQDAELTAAIRIVRGTQTMTVFKDTRVLGAVALKAALELARGKTPKATSTVNNGKLDVQSILLDPVVVTKDNLDKILIDSGYMKRADVYRK